ncbi:MAG: biopolymer transporter ExbD [Sedimentisphaerales bacterium]
MAFAVPKLYRGTVQSLNVIPFVDILFQLIIFFVLACQLIEAENPPVSVSVPDNCSYASVDDQRESQITTVTVMKDGREKSEFAIGMEKIPASNYREVPAKLAGLLDQRLKQLPSNNKTVTLRIDKDVPYSQAQFALAGIAKSSATDIRLAVIKEQQQPSPDPK